MSTQTLSSIHEADAYAPIVTITKSDGSALDLSAASVRASARRFNTTHEATITITDAAAGKVVAQWPAWTFSEGVWEIQIHVVPPDNGPQTVASGRLCVSASIFTAP